MWLIHIIRFIVEGLFNPALRPMILGLAGALSLVWGFNQMGEARRYAQGPLTLDAARLAQVKPESYVRLEGITDSGYLKETTRHRRGPDTYHLYYPLLELGQELGNLEKPRLLAVVRESSDSGYCSRCANPGPASFDGKIVQTRLDGKIRMELAGTYTMPDAVPLLDMSWHPATSNTAMYWLLGGVVLLALAGLSLFVSHRQVALEYNQRQKSQNYSQNREKAIRPVNWEDAPLNK